METALQVGYIIGFGLSLILFFYNHGFKTANRYLAAFFLFTSLFVYSQYLGLYSHSLYMTALFASSLTPFSFLIGPFFYLYGRSILRDNTKLSKVDYLHFLVFAVQFIGMIPYYLSSWENKISIAQIIISNDWNITHLNVNQIFKSPTNNYFRPIYLITYLLSTWILFVKYNPKTNHLTVPVKQQKLLKKWLLFILISFSFFLVDYFLLTVNLIIFHKSKIEFESETGVYLLLISIGLVVLNTLPLLFPEILYGLPKMATAQDVAPEITEDKHVAIKKITEQLHKIHTQDPQNGNVYLIAEKLEHLLLVSHPWTDENFSIATLSIDLKVPEHHLRYYFNHHLSISFPTYKNRLRVSHVRSIIEEGQHQHLSLEGIGSLAGFSSKSSFFSVFKTETGFSPLEYKEQLQLN
jgi:AraC-like DNA-binding protein